PKDAVVLSSPEVGLFLPTFGLTVVYGHPFETLHAAQRLEEVNAFYSGSDCSVVAKEKVGYIFVGPNERRIAASGQMCPITGEKVYETKDGEVAIYAAGQ